MQKQAQPYEFLRKLEEFSGEASDKPWWWTGSSSKDKPSASMMPQISPLSSLSLKSAMYPLGGDANFQPIALAAQQLDANEANNSSIPV